MGVSQSTDDARKDIRKLHTNNSLLYDNILKRGEEIVNEITEAGYNNVDDVCEKLGYHYSDKLNTFFKTVVMKGLGDKIKLGVVPDETPGMKNYKQKICDQIVDFHITKIKAITDLQDKLPLCIDKERQVFDKLSILSKETDINTEEWMKVYKKMKQFNATIKSKYSNIDRAIENIRKADTEPKLTRSITDAKTLLNNTNNVCEKYETEINIETKSLKRSIPTKVTRETSKQDEGKIIVGSEVEINKDLVYSMDGAVRGTLEYNAEATVSKGTVGIVEKIDNGWALVDTTEGKGAVKLVDLDLFVSKPVSDIERI